MTPAESSSAAVNEPPAETPWPSVSRQVSRPKAPAEQVAALGIDCAAARSGAPRAAVPATRAASSNTVRMFVIVGTFLHGGSHGSLGNQTPCGNRRRHYAHRTDSVASFARSYGLLMTCRSHRRVVR